MLEAYYCMSYQPAAPAKHETARLSTCPLCRGTAAIFKEAELRVWGLKLIVAGNGRKVTQCQGEVGLVKIALTLP